MTTRPPEDSSLRLIEDFDREPSVSSIDEQAAAWLIRLSSGDATAEERAAFAQWRDGDPVHAAALSRLRAIWGAVAQTEDLRPSPPAETVVTRVAPPRRRARAWALAASLLAALGLAYQFQTDWRHDETTAFGERRSVTLADGSTVLLGSGTALDVDFDGRMRRVALVHGEAYFEVRADAGRPFVIDAGSAQVDVVGTRFSVRRDAGAGAVTVVDGRVRVRSAAAEAVLGADQRLEFGRDGLRTTEAVDIEEALAWRSGRLVIRGALLGDVVAQINRHRAGTIIVRVDPARQRPINAVIALDRVDDWLAALEQQGAGRVASLGPLTVIY